MTVAGPIEAVNIGGREFGVLQDAESNRKLGGMENEILILGNGGGIVKQTRVAWMIDGLSIEIDDDRGDQEYIVDLCESGQVKTLSVTYASGVTYSAPGIVSGEVQTTNASQTASISLSGYGKLEKQ